MIVRETSLKGMMVVDSSPSVDSRGVFERFFCLQELVNVIGDRHIVQINHSLTRLVGAVRGLHYQNPPHMEMKFIRCVKGRVWDVGVDLRAGSPTFLHWHAEELSQENSRMQVIPEGCAHGFQVLEEDSELLYLHTTAYAPTSEGGLLHDDPSIGIRWPLAVTDVSDRDRRHPPLSASFSGVVV